MSLRKDQYDSIMLEYSKTRDRNRHLLEARRDEVYHKIPSYRALDEETPGLGMRMLEEALKDAPEASPDSSAAVSPVPAASRSGLRQTLLGLSARKKQLLLDAGYPENYLDPVYDCPDCRDTGYIGFEKCHCLRQKEIEILYDQSHIREQVKNNNFGTLSHSYYQGEDLARFVKAEEASRSFASGFGTSFRNLYLYGTVGTGKSFLSHCIAAELLKQGREVIYFSASGLFDKIAKLSFDYRTKEEFAEFTEDIYSADLLIIDDLGTEFNNSLVASALFTLINERILRRKPTVISTNLSMEELQNRYSDRVFSRIVSAYDIFHITGFDIRVQKKRRSGSLR